MTELHQGAEACRSGGRAADIISVQSQVIYGSVGNSVALPALARHGWQVLAVPTFLLSNTPDYPSCYGGEIDNQWFCGFLQGIKQRGQDRQLRAVITGYLGSVSKAQHLSAWLQNIVAINPDAIIVVDPVLGDDDTGFYVDPALCDAYRTGFLPLATGLTPNRFELSCLTRETLTNEREVIAAARTLLSENTRWIVVTSAARSEPDRRIKVTCVTDSTVHVIEHPSYVNAPKGTGDLFTAELTAGLLSGLTPEQATDAACEFSRRCVLHAQLTGSGMLNPLTLNEEDAHL